MYLKIISNCISCHFDICLHVCMCMYACTCVQWIQLWSMFSYIIKIFSQLPLLCNLLARKWEIQVLHAALEVLRFTQHNTVCTSRKSLLTIPFNCTTACALVSSDNRWVLLTGFSSRLFSSVTYNEDKKVSTCLCMHVWGIHELNYMHACLK